MPIPGCQCEKTQGVVTAHEDPIRTQNRTLMNPSIFMCFVFGGSNTKARELAIKVGVPVVPGTDGPVSTFEEAQKFIDGGVGYPGE